MADIPGIIDNASEGRGLGLQFLKHIERTKTLLFVIDIINYRDSVEQFQILKNELIKFSEPLSKRAYAIVLTKSDSIDDEEINRITEYFLKELNIDNNKTDFNDKYLSYQQDLDYFDIKKPMFITPISAVNHLNLKILKYKLYDLIQKVK